MRIFSFICTCLLFFLFFFNDTATTEIYTLSLHDALPISQSSGWIVLDPEFANSIHPIANSDRKSTRLNSSHSQISYAVFCLKKKKKKKYHITTPLVHVVNRNAYMFTSTKHYSTLHLSPYP